ncbi:MAG: dynamin family protein [Chthonomonadales bacterium]
MDPERLTHLELLAREMGAQSIADEAHALAERAREGRFYVACVGQFKRGKSTLINALTGAQVLPTGTVPVTSVVTVLRYGELLAARLRHPGEGWQELDPANLHLYVSEEENPGNIKQIEAVEVFVPSDLLSTGLCFVDTPGLGSVFAANTEATRDFVPHIDAALLVIGPDPPISGEEIALAEQIARNVDYFVFVLNKADRVTHMECDASVQFAQRVLSQRLARPVERIFRVSALERIAGGRCTRDWCDLEQHLRRLAVASATELVEGAVKRGILRLGSRLNNILGEEADALRRPIAETEERLKVLRSASEEASRALWEIGPLLDAEIQRIGRTFAQRREEFLKAAVPEALEELTQSLHAMRLRKRSTLRREAMQLALDIARRKIAPWLQASEREAEAAYRGTTQRLTQMVNELLGRLRASGAWSSVPIPDELGGDDVVGRRRRFAFNEFLHVASPAGLVPAVQWVGDLLLPRSWVFRSITRSAGEFLTLLLDANAQRVENSLKQRIQDSRLHLESELRFVLKEVLDAAERGIARARRLQQEGEEAMRDALHVLEARRNALERILRDSGG